MQPLHTRRCAAPPPPLVQGIAPEEAPVTWCGMRLIHPEPCLCLSPHVYVLLSSGAAGKTASATVSLVLVHAFPACAHVVGAAALWSRERLFGVSLPGGGRFGLALLRPLRASMLSLALARVLMPPLAPSLWRSIRYWRRIMPIFARYLWASYRAKRLRKAGKGAEAAALWEARHRAGAEEIHSMLNDLRGFYLKVLLWL